MPGDGDHECLRRAGASCTRGQQSSVGLSAFQYGGDVGAFQHASPGGGKQAAALSAVCSRVNGSTALRSAFTARRAVNQRDQSCVVHALPVIRISLEAAYQAIGLGHETALRGAYACTCILPFIASPYTALAVY